MSQGGPQVHGSTSRLAYLVGFRSPLMEEAYVSSWAVVLNYSCAVYIGRGVNPCTTQSPTYVCTANVSKSGSNWLVTT